jgi:predicted transcriptional regulator of viral defense system
MVFSLSDVNKIWPQFNSMNLLYWQKKGYIVKLRNGWYRFNEAINEEAELYYIANKIYSPSYVSLESALYYHKLIPEGVFSVRSVTTLKTADFKTEYGLFTYTSIKGSGYFGFQLVPSQNRVFKVAEPEKALLDYLYLNPRIKTKEDFEEMRLYTTLLREKINEPKFIAYAGLFGSKTLMHKAELFKLFIQ